MKKKMVNEDILSGLRNALDRGEDIETAMKSMISSGYDRFEVNESAKVIIKEISDAELAQKGQIVPTPPTKQISQPQSTQPQPTTAQPNPATTQQTVQPQEIQPQSVQQQTTPQQVSQPPKTQEKNTRKGLLISLIIFLLLVAAGLVYIILTKFKS